MEYNVVILENSYSELKNEIDDLYPIKSGSFNMPEFGLRYPLGKEFCDMVNEVRKKYENYDCGQHVVLIVINPKQWLITKLKYGV